MKYRFEDCELDEERRELRRQGHALELQPKVFDVLLLLVRNAGRMVGRDEILERVWQDVRVTEASLARCISLIRRELGSEVIRTVRGRGYQLGVPIEACGGQEAAASQPSRGRRRWLAWAAPAAVLVVLVWLGRPFHSVELPVTAPPPVRHASEVAVLPFAVLGDLPEARELGRRIPLEVIDRLASADELRLASSAASFALAPDLPPQQVGRTLAVGTLVLGNLRPAPDGLRTSVEVVEAHSGYRIWSKVFDAVEPAALPERIASDVARVLGASVEGGVGYVGDSPQVEAARYYLEGRSAVLASKREHLLRAVDLFERATLLDPDEARAYVALAAAYERLWGLDDPPSAWLARGEAAARKALERAPDDPEALTVLATIQRDQRRFTQALDTNAAAIDAGPSDRAHEAMARLLCMLGRLDDALWHANQAVELAPARGSVWFTLARIEYYRGRPEIALAHLERAIDLDPRLTDLPTMLARVHAATGNPAAAQESFLLISGPWFRPVLRAVDRLLGTPASLRFVLWLDGLRTGERCPTRGMGRALVWAELGETDRMLECVATAAEKHPWYAAVEPGFARYREDPRFRAILEQSGVSSVAAVGEEAPAVHSSALAHPTAPGTAL